MGEHTWEVAWVRDIHTRVVTDSDVTPQDLTARMSAVLMSGRALMVTRSDQTPAARAAKYEAEMYDLDRAGRRRRRYRRHKVEIEWEKVWTQIARDGREQRALDKVGTDCKECGARWSATGVEKYGLVHVCGLGLVTPERRDEWTRSLQDSGSPPASSSVD